MKFHDIREMIKLVHQSSIEELEWERNGVSVSIKKAAPLSVPAAALPVTEGQLTEVEASCQEAAAAAESAEETEAIAGQPAAIKPSEHTILCTTVGTFYASVEPGQQIKAGERIGRCTVEALQLTEDIHTSVDGTVTAILVADGQLADYGKPLVVVQQK